MANIDAAFGLRPYERSGSNYNNQGVNAYPINIEGMSDGTTSKIWTGSAVEPNATGLIDIVGNANGGTVPLLGVFMGCKYTALDGTPAWSAHFPGYAAIKAQTEATAFIADNPDALFVINADGPLPDADRFSNMNFATMITGNDTSGYSLGELDVSTTAVTATLNTKVIAFDDQASTASGSVDKTVAGRLAVVRLNVHFMDSLLGI
jgi:hypothetical protein